MPKTSATEVKTKETRGRKAVTKAVSPPPTERPTRATRSSTRISRKSVIEEAPEEKPSEPDVKPSRGRRGRPAAAKVTLTINSIESEPEKQPESPKRGSRRKAAEPVIEKPKKTKVEKTKPVKPATATAVTTTEATTTTTTTTNTTSISNETATTSTTSRSTRGRATKRSAAVVAAVAIDQSETPDEEDEAPKPKRATRARSTATAKEKPAARPARAGTRTSTRGRKKEPTPEPESESAPEAEEKESKEVPDKPKDEPVKSQQALDKIEEETDSMVVNEKPDRDPEILPTVVDVIEGIKEQVERTIEEIKESELNDTVPDTVEEKESAADDASSVAETRDSLDVNLDNNSIRDIPDDELKSIDEKSNDDKSSDKSVDEKPSDETLINDISDTENEKTSEIVGSKEDQIVPNASLENGEICKASGDSKDISPDKSLNDTEDDIGLDETLPMETLNDKNGDVIKRKTDDLDEEEKVTIAKQKQVKRARKYLLDIPDIPTVSGKVMTFGDDMCGELGLKETGIIKKRPVFVKDVDEPVVHIASGGMHNVCLTSTGQVYTWGCNDEGALGRETNVVDDRDSSAEPTKVPLPYKIVKVSAGDSHSAALTSTGSIYIWGNFKDSNGKIGLTCDSKEAQTQPIQIDIPNTTFVDLASGNDHLLILADTGEIFSLGVGEQGQLGRIPAEEMKDIKEKKEVFLKPSLVKFDEITTCDRIWAGQYSSYARTKTGDIFAWGLNNYSQLGIPQSDLSSDDKADLTVPFPLPVPSFKKFDGIVEQVCPGQHFMLARDSKGRVYSCGRHEYGRLGHGKQDESHDTPKLIESFYKELIKHITAGSVTSFAVSEKGDLYAWGMNGAALGLGGDEDAWTPTRVSSKSLENYKVISVAAGSQHTAIIVRPKNE